ncbi:hypothetical protein EDD86DRAFT_250052 [Gorgonomyces haynaldii]|nr:hypothetical protein EDD86DRAFT_250052 [Gorgonomyces haynaldii]
MADCSTATRIYSFYNQPVPQGNCCDWPGLTCLNGRIQKWVFYNTPLKGSLQLFDQVSGLQQLVLKNCSLTGPIDPNLSKLGHDLSYNQLTGSVPVEISALNQLQSLCDLSQNSFSGALPAFGRVRPLTICRMGGNTFCAEPGLSSQCTPTINQCPSEDQSQKNDLPLIIGASVGGAFVLAMFFLTLRRRKQQKKKEIERYYPKELMRDNTIPEPEPIYQVTPPSPTNSAQTINSGQGSRPQTPHSIKSSVMAAMSLVQDSASSLNDEARQVELIEPSSARHSMHISDFIHQASPRQSMIFHEASKTVDETILSASTILEIEQQQANALNYFYHLLEQQGISQDDLYLVKQRFEENIMTHEWLLTISSVDLVRMGFQEFGVRRSIMHAQAVYKNEHKSRT